MIDLIVLVADKNMEQTVKGLLGRHHSLGIRPVEYDIFVHARRDPGCLNEAHDFLRPFAGAYNHALVMFDREGCGREQISVDKLTQEVQDRLVTNGWPEQADVVIIDPELEVWVWSDSPHVAACLGWPTDQPSLRDWLAQNDHWPFTRPKPLHPKEAMEAALRQARKPRSSAIYMDLAQKVRLSGHTEPAFRRLTQALQRWFPI